jgi:hypothetical protein
MGCMSDRHAWNKDTPLPEFVLRQNVMLCRMSGIVGPCREVLARDRTISINASLCRELNWSPANVEEVSQSMAT